MVSKMRRVRAGWYTIAVVDYKDGLAAIMAHNPIPEEFHVDVVEKEKYRGTASTWAVYTRNNGVERSDHRDYDRGAFMCLKDARAFALAVAEWKRAGEQDRFPDRNAPEFRTWEAESETAIAATVARLAPSFS